MQKLIKYRNRLKNLQDKLIITLFLIPFFISTLHAQENTISAFDNLIGKIWKAEGTWGDGSKFKQEIDFSYSSEKNAVLTKSKGYTNKEQSTYGNRNNGIRKYDPTSKSIKFWEFDVFGGITEGTVNVEGKNMYYQYQYNGAILKDAWEYLNEDTYNFKVGSYTNGNWEQTYLETQFVASKDFDFYFDHQSLVVTDLVKTGDFYRDILKLKEIPHPDKKPGFRWFQIRGNSQLHLIKKDIIEFKKDKSIHLCLSTQNLELMIEHLIANEVDFYNWPGQKGSVTDRSDGVKQIYIQDPDGYWIEINTAKH